MDTPLAEFVRFVAGLALLVAGAEWLVRGASALARRARIPPLVVGLTVVAYGTSAPEMAVSVQAALGGAAGVAVGNVIGSNIFNVLFILGVCALVLPLAVERDLLRRDVWVMLAASALVPVLASDGRVDRIEGALLLLGAAAYTAWLIRAARRESAAIAPATKMTLGPAASLTLIAGGLGALVLGAQWLVGAATAAARAWGVSDLVIGLTVIAAGTSLPEVAASLAAVRRGERDLAVGNVVGSNIFNILAVLGASAALAPGGAEVVAAALRFDVPVMIAAAAACLPIFWTHGRIDRWEGAFFLGGYVAYTAWLLLDATAHEARGAFRTAMLWFVLPLAAATLAASLAAWRRGGRPSGR